MKYDVALIRNNKIYSFLQIEIIEQTAKNIVSTIKDTIMFPTGTKFKGDIL
jgi:hypothetical protein